MSTLPDKRRSFLSWRFSLRSIFVFFTLACLLLGWLLQEIHARRQQEAFVRRLELLGYGFGRQRMGSSSRFAAATWAELFDSEHLDQVVSVNNRGMPVTANDLRSLAGFPYLKSLSLSGIEIPAEAWERICALVQIESLSLTRCKFPLRDLRYLQRLERLKHLGLAATGVTDGDVPTLARCPGVTSLILSDCEITDAGVSHLCRLMRLRVLQIAGSQISDDGLSQLVALDQLEALDVHNTQVTHANVAQLQMRLPRLTVKLELGGQVVNSPAVADLRSARYLHFRAPFASDVTLPWLNDADRLNSLRIDSKLVTDAGIHHLRTLPQLSALHLEGTATTDAVLEDLGNMRQLRSLGLSGNTSDVGLAQLASLAEVIPLERLSLSGELISDAGIANLATFPRLIGLSLLRAHRLGGQGLLPLNDLRELQISEMTLSDEFAQYLTRMPALRLLAMTRLKVPDNVWKVVTGIPLERLEFEGMKIPEHALAEISGMPSLREIVLAANHTLPPEAQKLQEANSKLKVFLGSRRIQIVRVDNPARGSP